MLLSLQLIVVRALCGVIALHCTLYDDFVLYAPNESGRDREREKADWDSTLHILEHTNSHTDTRSEIHVIN